MYKKCLPLVAIGGLKPIERTSGKLGMLLGVDRFRRLKPAVAVETHSVKEADIIAAALSETTEVLAFSIGPLVAETKSERTVNRAKRRHVD